LLIKICFQEEIVKKFFVLFLALIVCGLALVGCSKKSEGDSQGTATLTQNQGEEKHYLFGETHMDLTDPFHSTIRETIQKAVEAQGDRLIYFDGALDQTRQNNGIEDMITQGIDILFLNPVDSQGVLPMLEACREAGIKVIAIDSGVSRPDLTVTYIHDDHYQGGVLTGKEIVRLYPDGAKIGLLENPLAESVVSRVKGLEDGIKGSKSSIIDRKAVTRMEQILSFTEDMIQAHPDMDVFWALNSDISLIIEGVLTSAGVADRIKVLSVGGGPAEKKNIAAGGVWATAAQSPITVGTKAVEVAYRVLAGEQVDPEYPCELKWITQENIGNFNTAIWE
jgi:ribose transport system substrate-binding protein